MGCRIGFSDGFGEPLLLCGSTDPVAGWLSPRYGEMVAAPQLRTPIRADSEPYGFILQPTQGSGTRQCRISRAIAGDAWIAFEMIDDRYVDYLLARTASSKSTMSAWDVNFDGSLIWLRTTGGEFRDCRRDGGRELRYRGRGIDLGPSLAPVSESS